MKKRKFLDKLKGWLVTLGVASVFGLAALGCSAAKDYQKVSAYEIADDYSISFYGDSSFDLAILYNYVATQFPSDGAFHSNVLDLHFYDDDEGNDYVFSYFSYSNNTVTFTYVVEAWYLSISYSDGDYSLDTVSIDSYMLWINPSDTGYQSLRSFALSYNAPQQTGNFITALTDFMSLLGGAIVQLATPVANGVVSFAEGLFIDNSHLSIMGGIIGIFAGIALAVGITSKVYTWVTTLGN